MSVRVLPFCLFLAVAILCNAADMANGRNLQSAPGGERELSSPSTEEVFVRKLGISDFPASLWPIPIRRSMGSVDSITSLRKNPFPAYDLVRMPGGAIKILPRSMKV